MREIICPPGLSDRLDRLLPRLINGLSRARARRLIAAGSVFLDGRRCRVTSRLVREGSRLRVEERAPSAGVAQLTILYEDDSCIAIDKPAGMPSAPTRSAAAGTALEELGRQLRARDGRKSELWLVHRLDRDTSGVLLVARTRAAALRLAAAFRERAVDKGYAAWVSGVIGADAGSITTPLRVIARRAVAGAGGRRAETRWHVQERRAERTFVRLFPTSGRMHQLRAHLKSIGHPVLGDRMYGGLPAPRMLLHSERLRFPHPADGRIVEVVAPFVL